MRSVMLNGISLAADCSADYTVRVQVLGARLHQRSGRARRQVVARVVAAGARRLRIRELVDQDLLHASELAGAMAASESLREPPKLAAAALLLVRRDRIAERVRLGSR